MLRTYAEVPGTRPGTFGHGERLHIRGNRFRHGIELGLRNLVVRKRHPLISSVHQRGARWIVDRNLPAARVDPIVQVAREEFRRRHCVRGCSGSYTISETLVRKEEERPVAAVIYLRNVHRPARRKAEVVLFVHGLLRREKTARVQGLIAQKLVGVSVKIVGA